MKILVKLALAINTSPNQDRRFLCYVRKVPLYPRTNLSPGEHPCTPWAFQEDDQVNANLKISSKSKFFSFLFLFFFIILLLIAFLFFSSICLIVVYTAEASSLLSPFICFSCPCSFSFFAHYWHLIGYLCILVELS